ncbi:VanZ family protein [Paenibacillus sp. TC-CSREp1]|uniref:VanZ family protein n=1 Tax=Paenibacillus sp. TC-CSREp1 TaxID=3410089 RepID=UPI003D040AEC
MKVMLKVKEWETRKQKHQRKRGSYKSALRLLLVFIWIAIIWSMSAQSYQQQDIQPWLQKLSQKMHIGLILPDVQFTYSGHEYSLKQNPYAFVEFFFRKTAHVFVYAVLAALVYGGLRYKRVNIRTGILMALIVVALIASMDEYIQQFSPERTSSIRDVGVDLIGGCFGIAVYAAIRALFKKK